MNLDKLTNAVKVGIEAVCGTPFMVPAVGTCEFIRKLVLAWNPDFTKLTPDEAKRLEKAENSGFVDETDVDWENLGVWAENHTTE